MGLIKKCIVMVSTFSWCTFSQANPSKHTAWSEALRFFVSASLNCAPS